VRPPGRQGAGAHAQHVRKLTAARLAADVLGVPTLLVARTDALAADLLTSDVDERRPGRSLTGERTVEGFFRVRPGLEPAMLARPGLRALRGPHLVRDRHARPGLRREFAEAIHKRLPGQAAGLQLLAVLQLEGNLDDAEIAQFQRELGAMGYKFQFITLAGFHA
jgi:isocitrate lyase